MRNKNGKPKTHSRRQGLGINIQACKIYILVFPLSITVSFMVNEPKRLPRIKDNREKAISYGGNIPGTGFVYSLEVKQEKVT